MGLVHHRLGFQLWICTRHHADHIKLFYFPYLTLEFYVSNGIQTDWGKFTRFCTRTQLVKIDASTAKQLLCNSILHPAFQRITGIGNTKTLMTKTRLRHVPSIGRRWRRMDQQNTSSALTYCFFILVSPTPIIRQRLTSKTIWFFRSWLWIIDHHHQQFTVEIDAFKVIPPFF